MILLLDTSTGVCKLVLQEGDWRYKDEWQADRGLAKGLLSYLHKQLLKHGKTWADIQAIGVYRGPGSFTGLRIGLTVLNTIADSQHIAIVGVEGDDWMDVAVQRIQAGEDDKLVLPLYGSDAKITTPSK